MPVIERLVAATALVAAAHFAARFITRAWRTGGSTMFKVVVALVLLAHGIGHSIGLLQLFKLAAVNPDWHGSSWLMTGPAAAQTTQVVGGLLWAIAIVGFCGLAAALVGWLPSSWFPLLAIGSSIASLMGLVLFPVAFPLSSTIGALVVDAAVLIATTYFWLLGDPAA